MMPTSGHCGIAFVRTPERVAEKPVRLRELAAIDLDEAIEHYRLHAGDQIAFDLIDALERAFRRIGHNPGIGNLRYGYELGIPDLRVWQVARFSYAAFYVDADELVDVWRVLNLHRNIPETLREPTT